MTREQYGQSAKKRHSRRGRVLLILAVLVAVAAGLLTWYITDLRYVDTPVLTSSSVADAKKEAEAEGFEFKQVRKDFSETFLAGTVMSTDPKPGEKILPGSTIEAIVSKGPDRVYIPEGNFRDSRSARPVSCSRPKISCWASAATSTTRASPRGESSAPTA
ncbi:PASTA domain-containing protein [Aeromicrobium sp. UC242_57]|uniref:PASTA domain-containing protein n=1 Tax=Aeromicrobium sp. UC242_57 TaxID=3374624 RepID=UPI0037A4FFFC